MHSYIKHSVIIIVFWNGSFLRSSLAYWVVDFPFPALKVRSDGYLSAPLPYFLHLLSSSSHEIRVFGFRKGSVVHIKFVILAHVPCHLWEVFRLHLILSIFCFLAKPEDNLEGSIGMSLSCCSSSLKDKVLLRRELSFGWCFLSYSQGHAAALIACSRTSPVCALFSMTLIQSLVYRLLGACAYSHGRPHISRSHAILYYVEEDSTLEVPPRVLHSRAAPSPWHVLLLAVENMQPPPQKEDLPSHTRKGSHIGISPIDALLSDESAPGVCLTTHYRGHVTGPP